MSRWIICLGSLIWFYSVNAQLTFNKLQDLWQYADKHSPVYKQGNIQRSISEEDRRIVRSGLLPKIGVFGTIEYYPVIATQVIPSKIFGGPDDEYTKVRFGLPLSFSTGVEVNMPVINFEKWDLLEKARLQIIQTDWSQKAQVEDMHIRISQWYYQGLAAKAMTKLNNEDLRITDELMRVMDARKNNGVLDPADYNRSKNLRLDILSIADSYEQLWRQSINALHSLLNIPDSVTLDLTDSLGVFNWPMANYNVVDISKRPQWNEAIARVDVFQKGYDASRKSSLPTLSFYGRYSYNWQMGNTQSVNFDMSTLGMRLDILLFNGDNIRSQQRRAGWLLESARTDQEQTRNNLVQQQRDWWNNYLTAWQKQKSLVEKESVTAENLRIAALNLREGVMEFDEFNQIFREHTRAQVEYVQNLSDGVLYYLLLTQNLQ
jgi:outer membrane protein